MYGDDENYQGEERRRRPLSLVLIEYEVHQLIQRMDKIEPKVNDIPELISRKLDEQANKLLKSRESQWTHYIQLLTLAAAVCSIIVAVFKH